MTEAFYDRQLQTLFSMLKSDNTAHLKAEQVSLFGNSSALKNRPWSIFIDYLGFKVYRIINRTRHASGKLVFQCAPGGSFFVLSALTKNADDWGG